MGRDGVTGVTGWEGIRGTGWEGVVRDRVRVWRGRVEGRGGRFEAG